MSNADLSLHSDYLIKLLRASLNKEVVFTVPKMVDMKKIYYLANLHSITPAVYPAIKNIPWSTIKAFKDDSTKSWRKNAVQFIELSSILSKTDEFKIDCIPLKGCVMKELYPSPEMRTMADLDFLFDHRRIEDVNLIMYALGYMANDETPNHHTFYKEPVMNVEFHPSLFNSTISLATFFNPGWRYAKQTGKGVPLRKLTNEGFYIYLVAHLTQHFQSGGVGIRAVMDIWVYLKNYKSVLDWKFIDLEFKRARIFEFSNNIFALAEMWFGLGKPTPILIELSNFIIKSGTYGLRSTDFNSNLGIGNKIYKNKVMRFVRVIFPPYSIMKAKYSFVKKYPFLLPIGWIVRAYFILINERKEAKSWINSISNVTEETVKAQSEMFARFGL